MKEFKLAPEARPHSITADAAGSIWYTGNGNGTVGLVIIEKPAATTTRR